MLKDITYEYIWRNIIEPNIIEIRDKAKNSSVSCDLKMEELSKVKNKIFDSYEKKRDRLKLLYHFDDGTEDRRIDCHKIAACFAAVIFEDKVFSYKISREVTDDIYLANARLAYCVSLGIIFTNLLFQYKYNQKDDIVSELLKKQRLEVPPTNPGHDPYNLGREKSLALNNMFDNEFDILTYSDMMFWIEYYNRQILENTISPKPFDANEDLFHNVV